MPVTGNSIDKGNQRKGWGEGDNEEPSEWWVCAGAHGGSLGRETAQCGESQTQVKQFRW